MNSAVTPSPPLSTNSHQEAVFLTSLEDFPLLKGRLNDLVFLNKKKDHTLGELKETLTQLKDSEKHPLKNTRSLMFRLSINDFDDSKKDKLVEDLHKLQNSLDNELQFVKQLTFMKNTLKQNICKLQKNINARAEDLRVIDLHAAKVKDVTTQAELDAAQAHQRLLKITKDLETLKKKRQERVQKQEEKEERLKSGVARLSQQVEECNISGQCAEQAKHEALNLLKQALERHSHHKRTQEQSAAYIAQCQTQLTTLKQ